MTEMLDGQRNQIACSALMVLTALQYQGQHDQSLGDCELAIHAKSSYEEEQAELLVEIRAELSRIAMDTVQSVSGEVCAGLLMHLTNGLSSMTDTVQ